MDDVVLLAGALLSIPIVLVVALVLLRRDRLLEGFHRVPRKRLVVFLAASVVVNLMFAAGVLYEHREEAAPIVAHFFAPQSAHLGAIAALFPAEAYGSDSERIVAVRDFVTSNSIHAIDAEHEEYAGSPERVVDMLYESANAGGPAPHLSCGPRALAMLLVLEALGYDARLVHVFSDEHDDVRSHTFVEVLDPQLDQWVAHDPDFGVHYVPVDEGEGSEMLPVNALVFGDPEAALPCDAEETCAWESLEVDHLRDDFFEAVMYDRRADDRNSALLVNTERFDVDKEFSGNDGQTFREFVSENYDGTALVLVDPVIVG